MDWSDRSPISDALRKSDYGAEWRRKRRIVLERDGHLCQCAHCKAESRTAIATEVDHIVSKARAYALGWKREQVEALSNLQAINAECHLRKSREERGHEYKPKRKIGIDGFPIDTK